MLKPEETLLEIKNERQLKAISGVTESQLKLIATEFEVVENEDREEKLKQRLFFVRKPGGGRAF